MTNQTVSIVIPTLNNQDTIAVCLESIKQQTYDSIEVLVIDGGSSDLTPNICKTYDVRLIEDDLGMSAARVKGASLATGEYLFHVDSDMELTPNVVKECIDQSKRYDALIIPETNIGDSYWAKCTDIGKRISQQQESGNLRFLPRRLYFKGGGHNPKLLGKEDEEFHNLVAAHGASIGHIDNHIQHHIGDVGFLDIIAQRWTYIKSLSAYKDYSRDTTPNKSSVSSASTLTIIMREFKRQPRYALGYIFLSICTAFLSQIAQKFLLDYKN